MISEQTQIEPAQTIETPSPDIASAPVNDLYERYSQRILDAHEEAFVGGTSPRLGSRAVADALHISPDLIGKTDVRRQLDAFDHQLSRIPSRPKPGRHAKLPEPKEEKKPEPTLGGKLFVG